MRPRLAARCSLLAFLAVAAHAQTTALQLRAGESINGFPTWAERVELEWMNRARVAPQTEMAACGAACGDAACYTPQPPLYWSEALNHAARFHAAEMTQQGYFAHDSKCTLVPNINGLYPVGCDGSASCGCVGGATSCAAGGCTAWSTRVGLFGAGPVGEIIAGSTDPNGAFYLWLFEPAAPPLCGFTINNGHRWLILTSQGGVGVGVSGLNSVGDFGSGAVASKIASAAHYPQQAASVEIWANWYDSAAPRSANAIVDGHCTAMSLQRGTHTNGAWKASANSVGSGCHRYYVSFIDSAGNEVTWPATGSLGIGCEDWNSTRMQASCSSTPPPTNTRHRTARH
jgi:hypothetical protein